MSGPLFGCKNPDCAAEVSLEPGMLALWKDEPICEECYHEASGEDDPSWTDLPAFVPDTDKRIAELEAENERLRAALAKYEPCTTCKGRGYVVGDPEWDAYAVQCPECQTTNQEPTNP